MGRGNGGTPTGSHRNEQRRQRRNNSDSEEIQESTEEDEATILSGILPVFWNQEPRIHAFEEDGSQRDGEAAV